MMTEYNPDHPIAQLQERRKATAFTVPESHQIIRLYSGDCYVTDMPNHVMVTILGSCVSACIRDPLLKIGGMNHFLLPGCGRNINSADNEATRYGAYAMERLINGILRRGGEKSRLEIKLFGGANVTSSSIMIGDTNVTFIKEYMIREGLKITSADLGGTYPRRVHYYPDTGKVMMLNLQRKEDMLIANYEQKYAASLNFKSTEGEINLF